MTRTRTVYATGEIGDGAPNEFRLLKSGINTYSDGDKILFDDQAAEETMRRYRAHGVDLMADYEHDTLNRALSGPRPASAKKWVPEVRSGDLMATQIAWTDKAKSMLAAGEYRYYSIACRVDAKTNRCVELINFALTNTPAADGIEPLVAASRPSEKQEQDMKTIVVALGLNAESDETAAVAKASRLAELEREVLTLTQKSNLAEAMGVLQAQRVSHEQVVALTAEVQKFKSAAIEAEFDAVFRQAESDMKIPPAADHPVRKYALALKGKTDAVGELKGYVSTLVALVAKSAETPKPAVDAGADQLTAEEIAVAKTFVGDNPIALDKRLTELRAMKAQDKRSAA